MSETKKIILGNGYFDFDKNKSEYLKLISKFLLLQKGEEKILVCGVYPYIGEHRDIEQYFDIYIGNFNEFEIIGAGSMRNGSIENFSTMGYGLTTKSIIAYDILKYLGISIREVDNFRDMVI